MIPFELTDGLIVVPALFAYGQSEITPNCLVDTGSAGTAVEIDLVQMDYSRPSRIVEIAGIGGDQEVVIQSIEMIAFCEKQIENFEVQFGDIASKFGFNAIIGSDILDALGINIDYERREIRASKS